MPHHSAYTVHIFSGKLAYVDVGMSGDSILATNYDVNLNDFPSDDAIFQTKIKN